MVPLLLLLLLPVSLAEEVQNKTICFQISDFEMANNMTDIVIDQPSGYVSCILMGFQCLIECTSSQQMQFNTFNCFEAEKKTDVDKITYKIDPYSICHVYPCNETSILDLIEPLDNVNSDELQLMKLFHIKNSCPKLFKSSHAVKAAYIGAEKQVIHNKMGASHLETGSLITYNMKELSLKVVNITESGPNSSNPMIKLEPPQLLSKKASFIPEIWLPKYELLDIPKEKRVLGLVSYMHNNQFQFEEEEISSLIIRIEVLDQQPLRNLKTPIQMTFGIFPDIPKDNDSQLQCHYFDEHDYEWKTDGCETNHNQTDIICSCNHATPFAVLLTRTKISEVHWKILSYISYIGCGLSVFFTALSIVLYVFSRILLDYDAVLTYEEIAKENQNHRMDYSISIHVSLSGALLLLNSTFLLTEWGATVEPEWVCMFVAALMHYALLSCFTWMAIEALHLYLLLIKVFNTYFKHYLVKLSLIGWGIPGVIVAVSLGMKDFKQFYGVTEMALANTNQTSAICWITDDSFFYSVNLVYFALIFIFNSGILVSVASNICKMKQVFRNNTKFRAEAEKDTWIDSQRFNETCRSGLTVMGLTCLMGTTWGLAFLGSGYVNYPILYLFCILNSAQGFFIFLWICLSAKKQRERVMEERLSSTPVKTSGVKFD